MNDKKTQLKFTPLENGLDYISHTIEILTQKPEPRELKYAILSLHAGVESILKYRLALEHWTLGVSPQVRDLDFKKYKSGDLMSVGTNDAIKRLSGVCGIALTVDEQARIEDIQRLRNKLQHFGLETTVGEVGAKTSRALDFMLTFVDRNVRAAAPASDQEKIDELLCEIREDLTEIDGLVAERMQSVLPRLSESARPVVECPTCRCVALQVGDPICKCYFCLNEFEAEEAANEYAHKVLVISRYEVFKDGGTWPVHECPECALDTFFEPIEVHHPNSGSTQTAWTCFNCGEVYAEGAVGSCDRCGAPVVQSEDGLDVCEVCFDNVAD